MTNQFIDDGIKRLRTKWPQAHLEQGDYGAHLIIVPSVLLPRGYKQTICTVLFVAPPGFPFACPDHFFTDIEVELDQACPCWPAATVKWHPGLGQGNFPARTWPQWKEAMWWSWHLQHWNPNRDSLFTYMKVIQQRLALAA